MGKSEHTFALNDAVGTPEDILAPIRAFAPIGLDPCSHPTSIVGAKVSVLLPAYDFGSHDWGDERVLEGDGLKLHWGGYGLVYVNPPYSRLATDPWIAKARTEADEALLLLPVRTSGAWWQDDVRRCQAVTFLRGRVTHTGAEHGAPFHQCLVYCGPRALAWRQHAARHAERLGWTILAQDWGAK